MNALKMLLAVVPLAILAWWSWSDAPPEPGQGVAVPTARPAAATLQPAPSRPVAAGSPASAETDDGYQRVPLLPVDQSRPAALSLAETHLRGEPRTPPIERVVDPFPVATDAEKADPAAYAAYEARQNLRVFAAFNQAANQTLPQLRADIERGRQLGIEPEKIAKAEEKYRRIAEEQANILRQHPELKSKP